MLQMRRAEKDFLLRLDKKYLEKHAAILAELKTKTAEIRRLSAEIENQDAENLAAEVDTLTAAYRRISKNWWQPGKNAE